jgi:hypothetical protein
MQAFRHFLWSMPIILLLLYPVGNDCTYTMMLRGGGNVNSKIQARSETCILRQLIALGGTADGENALSVSCLSLLPCWAQLLIFSIQRQNNYCTKGGKASPIFLPVVLYFPCIWYVSILWICLGLLFHTTLCALRGRNSYGMCHEACPLSICYLQNIFRFQLDSKGCCEHPLIFLTPLHPLPII